VSHKQDKAGRVLEALQRDPELLAEVRDRLNQSPELPKPETTFEHPLDRAIRLLQEGRQAFHNTLRAHNTHLGTALPPKVWRAFMRDDAMPRNREVADILLEEFGGTTYPPPVVVAFLAYTSDYHALIEQWDKGDFTDATIGRNFPTGLDEFLEGRRSLRSNRPGRGTVIR
jgi:hypothetical protein